MTERSEDLIDVARDIRKLLELLAEPAVAQRDARLRAELRRIVGASQPKRRSVLLMDGNHRQKDIVTKTSIRASNLSTLVTQLGRANLLSGDAKLPKLAISIPPTFFDSDAES